MFLSWMTFSLFLALRSYNIGQNFNNFGFVYYDNKINLALENTLCLKITFCSMALRLYLMTLWFNNLFHVDVSDYGRGTDTWGVWINGKYDNGSWLDGTNKILENIYWDSTAPLQPYVGTCMTFSYTQRGLLITNRDCTWRYISFCQVMI